VNWFYLILPAAAGTLLAVRLCRGAASAGRRVDAAAAQMVRDRTGHDQGGDPR
jgi:hypothetical protein